MEFLSGKSIFDQVKKFINSKDRLLRIAVSYWGKEVLDKTGLEQRIDETPDSVRVICDLSSPGCNPEPIKQLKDARVEVKTLKNFHAKVWVCGSAAIIGSSNFSKNGLGYDEKIFLSNKVEACLLVKDRSIASILESWFEEQWHKAEEVDDKKLKEASVRKKLRDDAERELITKERNRLRKDRKENLKEELRQLAQCSFQSDQNREEFFRILLTALKKEDFAQANYVRPRASSQISFRSNRQRRRGQQSGIRYFVRVASSDTTRVELNIDNKQLSNEEKQIWNKQKFKEIEYERDVIEQRLGETLEWNLKPKKHSSSIAAIRKETIHDEGVDPQEILLWIIDKLIAFDKTFEQYQAFGD